MQLGDEEYIGQNNPRPIMVNQNQDANQILINFQQNTFTGQNNTENMAEQSLV